MKPFDVCTYPTIYPVMDNRAFDKFHHVHVSNSFRVHPFTVSEFIAKVAYSGAINYPVIDMSYIYVRDKETGQWHRKSGCMRYHNTHLTYAKLFETEEDIQKFISDNFENFL